MTYRSFKRAWIGFKVAKQEANRDKMKYYTERYTEVSKAAWSHSL